MKTIVSLETVIFVASGVYSDLIFILSWCTHEVKSIDNKIRIKFVNRVIPCQIWRGYAFHFLETHRGWKNRPHVFLRAKRAKTIWDFSPRKRSMFPLNNRIRKEFHTMKIGSYDFILKKRRSRGSFKFCSWKWRAQRGTFNPITDLDLFQTLSSRHIAFIKHFSIIKKEPDDVLQKNLKNKH